MKISKYENSMFPYSLHSTVNLSAWRLRDTSVTLMSFSVYPLIQLLPKEKGFFSKSRDKYFQNQRNPYRIVNFPFCDVITKIRTCIFVTSCESMNVVSGIRNSMIRTKKYTQIPFVFTF